MAFNLAPSANKGKLKMESFLSDDVQLTRGEVNIADLIAWENQPFKLYSEEKMQEMMKSIEANGLITPITVRPYGEGKYQILAGHNRAEACRRLEMTTIPATIMNVNDHQAKLVVVDTNLCQRIELLPSERAFAYKMQCEALVALGHCKSTNEVAERYGENRRTVQRYLACTRLSGLLGVIQNSNLQRHWNYVRSSITELFDGMENDINTDVKNEVYDFMPDFSINLSKATIGNKFDGNSLILYDEEEIAAAEYVMLQFARQLRSITNETDFNAFMADYPDDTLEYTDIIKIQFTDDTGIDNIDKYEENLQRFLFMRASEQLSQYTYTYKEVRIDGKPAEVQTLVVLDNAGDTQTVEYTCIGGGEIYIPQFLAMFSVYQSREFLLSNTLSDESLEVQFEEIVGEIPVTAEAAEAYFEESWKSVVDGKGAINLGVFETSNLCKIIEEANLDGAVKIDVERTKDKLSITLETAGSDIWAEIFGVTGDLEKYVTETQYAIEMALDEAGVPVAERTLSLDNMVQAALFVYFEGFFELPVDSSELASGSNGILSQYGDVSDIHEYNYGSIANDYGLPERGITLHLENADTEIHADLLNCDDSVITEAFIYDVWNAEEHELDRANMPSAIQNPANKIFNRSAVTIAYIIDTGEFEKVYGFPFPKINNYYPNGDTVTLLLEFTCLDRLNGIVELDKGRDIEELFGSRDNVVIGYCHNGYYDSEYDKSGDEMGYYHTLLSDECIPHICVKTFFYTGSVSRPTVEANDIPSYNGPSTISDSSTTAMRVNPRLWFKGFRTGMSEELFETLSAIQP